MTRHTHTHTHTGAVDRSSKFEEEKKQLLEAMNDQKNNAANASKEVRVGGWVGE